MGKADLHIHTNAGDGLDSISAILDHAEARADLDVIAVTEHDDVRPGLRARELAASRGLRVEVVAGVEITTLQGHLVALYLERPVPSLRRIEETIVALREQGALCFVPHPMSWLTRSVGPSTLDRLAALGLLPDALELACGTLGGVGIGKTRRLNAERYGLPAVGASDAHFREAIGSAFTRFEGSSAADFRRALASSGVGAERGARVGLAPTRRLRVAALPLTGLRATPGRLGWRRTAWSFAARYVA